MGAAVFTRVNCDQQVTPIDLEGLYGGPEGSACWLIGGGPSLDEATCAAIARSPIPKMTVNLAGAGRLRPDFWTSYDPTARFHRSIYLDPGILKFVHRRRAMDLVPETTFKACECPATICIEREGGRGFANVIDPRAKGIVDWADSLVQGLDILYRLGFRRIYLAGCELRVLPTKPMRELAEARGVTADDWWSLTDFVRVCALRGIGRAELERLGEVGLYHFDEGKSLAAAMQTDGHYDRIAQGLRLSRSCFARWGLELISVTPESRLNDHFPYRDVEAAVAEIHARVGDPAKESTRGCYGRQTATWVAELEPMHDVKPPNWPAGGEPVRPKPSLREGEAEAVGAAVLPGKSIAEGELVVEHEGWLVAGREFAEAYVPPEEAG